MLHRDRRTVPEAQDVTAVAARALRRQTELRIPPVMGPAGWHTGGSAHSSWQQIVLWGLILRWGVHRAAARVYARLNCLGTRSRHGSQQERLLLRPIRPLIAHGMHHGCLAARLNCTADSAARRLTAPCAARRRCSTEPLRRPSPPPPLRPVLPPQLTRSGLLRRSPALSALHTCTIMLHFQPCNLHHDSACRGMSVCFYPGSACAPEGLPRDMLSLDTQMVWYGATQPPTSGMPLMLACSRYQDLDETMTAQDVHRDMLSPLLGVTVI